MENRNVDGSSQLLPVSVLTGFLGSGKTTVLNHLLRQPELDKTLVIINEFGDIGLDHETGGAVERRHGVCCRAAASAARSAAI